MATAVATSLVVIVTNSSAGLAAHLSNASIGIAGAFTAAAVVGSLAAGRLAPRPPDERLRRGFAYLVLAVAAYVIDQTVLTRAASTERKTTNESQNTAMGGGGMGNDPQPGNAGDTVLATLDVIGSDVPTLPAVAIQGELRDLRGLPSLASVSSPSP